MFGTADQIVRTVDVSQPLGIERLKTLFFTDDKDSTDIVIRLVDGDKNPLILTGYTAELLFIRPDGAMTTATATIAGETVTAGLTAACLEVQGTYSLAIRMTDGSGNRKVVYAAEGDIRLSESDAIIADGDRILSLEELLPLIDRLESLHDNNVKGYYATLAALEAAQPDPYPGDLYGVNASGATGFTYYIYDGVGEEWKNLGDIFLPEAAVYADWSESVSIASAYGGTAKVIQHGTAIHVEYVSNASVEVTWDKTLLTLPEGIRPSTAQYAILVYANRSVPNVGYGTVRIGTDGTVTINNVNAAASSQILLNFWYEP